DNISAELLDANSNVLASSSSGSGTEQLNYSVQPADVTPFYLRLQVVSGYSDYSIDATLTPLYDESEDNDDKPSANAFPLFDFYGYQGSLGTGPGYPGYDG